MPITFAPFGRTRYFRYNKHWYRVVYEGRGKNIALQKVEDYRSRGYDVVGLTSNAKLMHFARAAFDLPEAREYSVGVWKRNQVKVK